MELLYLFLANNMKALNNMGLFLDKIFPHVSVLFIIMMNIDFLNGALPSEKEIQEFLEGKYEVEISYQIQMVTAVRYAYETNITQENEERFSDYTAHYSEYVKKTYDEWFRDICLDDIKNATVKRMLRDVKLIGDSALDAKDLRRLNDIKTKMVNIYSSAKICPYDNLHCDLDIDGMNFTPDIELKLADTKDYNELKYLWNTWHTQVGRELIDYYPIYVQLSNKFSKLNGFKDYGEYWRYSFEMDSFVDDMENLWEQVSPLYQQLHSYTAYKLKSLYGPQINVSDGLIPAHVFGNMWAQSWGNLIDILKPFPNEPGVDITSALRENGFDIFALFKASNDFYMSLGLPSSAMSYGVGSLIQRPKDREVVCHPSAWDMGNKRDFFIKMCTDLTQFDFLTVHHEMGHIMYYQLYKDQPHAFRGAANPAFHEAFGDTIALSAESIEHLKILGLVPDNFPDTMESDLNRLMTMALTKVAFIPFGYLMDKWRWEIFANNLTEDKWNERFWQLREKYQLLKPPEPRTSEDFDGGAKFHVPADVQYISYFVSHIIQFQIYRGLCIAAKQYDPKTKNPPLHKCDFHGSTEAGDIIREALSLGSSKPWPEILKILSGTDKLDAGALLEYFEPLSNYFQMFGYY